MITRTVQNYRTINSTPPTVDKLVDGEIAIGMNPDLIRIWFKDSNNNIREIVDKEYVDSKADSATTLAGYGITDAVQAVSGKGLSTNDYTTDEKNKLSGIASGAEVNVNADWNSTSGDSQILNKPTTLSGYGITDAKINNGTITLGSNSIVPLTSDDKIKTVSMTNTTATISANTFYVWGEVTSLTITLATPSDTSIYNEYMFQFTSGTSATTLSLPSSITWYQSNNTISASKTYQISIVNNLAVLGEF